MALKADVIDNFPSEIVGRSGNMSNGYHNREQANTDMYWYDQDGLLYYKSGYVGYLDEDGWLYLSDRKKDLIISGGFNIYATDLELVLLEHPAGHHRQGTRRYH